MTFFKFFDKFKFFYTCVLYDSFFKTVNSINLSKREKTQTGIKTINTKARYQVFLVEAFFLIFALFFILGGLLTTHLTEIVNFAFCNVFFIEGISSRHYFWFVENLLLVMYIVYRVYFCNGGVTFTVLFNICKHSREDFFIQSSQSFLGQNISIVQFIRGRLLPLGKVYLTVTLNSISKYLKILKNF